MKVVLETVVLVRAMIDPKSACGQLLHERRHRYQPVISPAITAEYFAVLQRPAIARKYGIPEIVVMRTVLDLVRSGAVVEPPLMQPVCRDPNDDKFLAAALAGDAAAIVSGDLELLHLKSYERIPILSAKTVLQLLNRAENG